MKLWAFLAMLWAGVAAETPVVATSAMNNSDLFVKPIMYGTALVLAVSIFGAAYFVYRMSDEKDPLIYSKFLTVKKKNQ
jgi:hypothetical protein